MQHFYPCCVLNCKKENILIKPQSKFFVYSLSSIIDYWKILVGNKNVLYSMKLIDFSTYMYQLQQEEIKLFAILHFLEFELLCMGWHVKVQHTGNYN